MRYLLALAALPLAAQSQVITFAELAHGTNLSNQYQGLTFTPNTMRGPGWATNTDLRVATKGSDLAPDLTGPDKVLHTYTGWIVENGNASFTVSFDVPAISLQMIFAGVFQESAQATAIQVFNNSTLLGTANAAGRSGNVSLSWQTGFDRPITSVVVTPGSTADWVAVDTMLYTLVPEPATYLLMAFGVAGLLWRKR